MDRMDVAEHLLTALESLAASGGDGRQCRDKAYRLIAEKAARRPSRH